MVNFIPPPNKYNQERGIFRLDVYYLDLVKTEDEPGRYMKPVEKNPAERAGLMMGHNWNDWNDWNGTPWHGHAKVLAYP